MKLLNGMSMGSVAMGAGVVLLAPVVIPVVGAILKPVAKALIKGSILAYEGAKVSIAETKETIEDIAAEAKADIEEGTAK
jgi:glucose dehydrogenase